MSDLRIVKGNDFATLYTIRAMYADGTTVEDFDLRACTDVQVIVHRTYSKSVASLLSANEYGSYSLEPENVLRINWDGLLVKLGTYTVDFRAKFRGADIRSYSIRDLVFDIVETNEEANIPAGAFVDNGTYRFSGEFVLMFESQLQADWEQTDDTKPDYIKNKPAIPTVPTNVSAFVNDAGYVNDISMKVDKEQGKGLSSNDYTTEEKTKLAGLENYDDTAVRGLIAGKQDIINDLATIRSGAGLGATAYQKPSTGIPASDIADGVIPTVPTNVSTFTNDAGYLTAHQDISGKEDKMLIDARSTSVSALVAEVNKYYRLDVPAETLAITLPTVTDATSVKSIVFYMTGGTTPSITFTSTHNVYYSNGFGIESGKTYEVNALYNGIAWVVASVEIVTSNS